MTVLLVKTTKDAFFPNGCQGCVIHFYVFAGGAFQVRGKVERSNFQRSTRVQRKNPMGMSRILSCLPKNIVFLALRGSLDMTSWEFSTFHLVVNLKDQDLNYFARGQSEFTTIVGNSDLCLFFLFPSPKKNFPKHDIIFQHPQELQFPRL